MVTDDIKLIDPIRRGHHQDGTNWKELDGKPAIFNWNGKPMAGTLYLDVFSNLTVRGLSGYMPVLYVWPDDTAHVNVKHVMDFHVFISLRIDVVRDAETAASIPIPKIIRTYYPGFDTWFDRTVLPSLGKDRAILLACTDDGLAGFCVLKRTSSERKICTLYVYEGFRSRGVGSALVEYALGLLDERFPLVTVPEELLPVYERFFRRFGFRLSGSRVGLYRVGKREFFFNIPRHNGDIPPIVVKSI